MTLWTALTPLTSLLASLSSSAFAATRFVLTDKQMDALMNTVGEISTEYFFLLILYIAENFITSMTFYIILMIFAYKVFALFSAHLTAKKMADQLGYYWPYSDNEKRRMVSVFEKGLEVERGDAVVSGEVVHEPSG